MSWTQLAIIEAVDSVEKKASIEMNEMLMSNTLRKELNEFSEFMFLMLHPEPYKKWKAEKEQAEAEAEGKEYEYVELPDIEKEDFEKLVMHMNQLPSSPDDDVPDLISMDDEMGSVYFDDGE